MKSILFTVFIVLAVSGAEIFYPKEPLQKDPLENGRSVFPASTSGNTVSVDYQPASNIEDPDSVYGGFARSGAVENNRLTVKNGHVSAFVLGGFSVKGNVKGNSVVVSGGTHADAAIGKVCGGQTRNGDVIENTVTVMSGTVGGKVVGDVYGGDADADGNATGNRIEISGGEFSGFVNGGGVSGVGIAKQNRVTISGGSVGMGVSAGFAHFGTGSPTKPPKADEPPTNSVLENTVTVSGKAEITGNVSGGFILDSGGFADRNRVEITGGTIRGNVYGGRAFSGRAVGNTVVISGGTIKERDEVVYAGYVHKPETGRATQNTVTLTGSPELKTITIRGNNLPTWKSDGNTLNFKGFRGTIRGFSNFQDVNVDENSEVIVIGDGPHEIFNLNNKGKIIFQNKKPTVLGKVSGNPPEYK